MSVACNSHDKSQWMVKIRAFTAVHALYNCVCSPHCQIFTIVNAIGTNLSKPHVDVKCVSLVRLYDNYFITIFFTHNYSAHQSQTPVSPMWSNWWNTAGKWMLRYLQFSIAWMKLTTSLVATINGFVIQDNWWNVLLKFTKLTATKEVGLELCICNTSCRAEPPSQRSWLSCRTKVGRGLVLMKLHVIPVPLNECLYVLALSLLMQYNIGYFLARYKLLLMNIILGPVLTTTLNWLNSVVLLQWLKRSCEARR